MSIGTYMQGPQTSGSYPAAGRDVGYSIFAKSVTILADGNATLDTTTYLPDGARIVDVKLDTTTAHTSGTATLAGGSTVGGTDFFSATNVKAGGRATPTFTAAQLAAIQPLVHVSGQSDVPVYIRQALGATITAVGSTTVTILYTLELVN